MPKHEIDYSNTIIYKITCNDSIVSDLYVGHTTNFVQRKHAHKQNCINEKSPNYKCKLYEVIRNNGGWINWKMEIINFFNCKNHYEARKKEQEYFLSLNATLNSIEPYAIPKPKEVIAKMATNIPNNFPKYICEICDIKTSNKKDYNNHLLTRKHLNNSIPQHLATNNKKNFQYSQSHVCMLCDKIYDSRSGLWRHQKKCKEPVTNNISTNLTNGENTILNEMDMKSLILELVKSNRELQKQMIEVCKNGNGGGINNSYNHSNNKTFNMQVFLNEKCKDAMNIMDFVNSMTLNFSDLEELGELGYVEGISRQMVRKLSEMDMYKRPIHCSDLKRETMYVRDNNVWEKETDGYDNLRKAIKYITKKNGDLMIPWRNAHPQCMNLQHPLNDKYLGIMNQAMGGKGEFAESESKIIRKISKCVTINKNDL